MLAPMQEPLYAIPSPPIARGIAPLLIDPILAVSHRRFGLPASRPDGGAVDLREQTIPDHSEHPAFLEDKDAAICPLSNVPAPTEKPIDIPSLQLKLSSLLAGDRQLERRARKLAWHLSKGRRLTCGWDSISLSELTPAESRMPDDEFLALYTDQAKRPNKKGGRPRKYRTATAERKAPR